MQLKSPQKYQSSEPHEQPAGKPPVRNEAYLHLIGARVRALRQLRKYSRRELSELCGLSQRFIAQVENGSGNISVLRLKELLDALKGDIEIVLAPETEAVHDPLIDRIKNASPIERARIAAIFGMSDLPQVANLDAS